MIRFTWIALLCSRDTSGYDSLLPALGITGCEHPKIRNWMTYARKEYLLLPVAEFIYAPKHDIWLPKETRDKSSTPLNAFWINTP